MTDIGKNIKSARSAAGLTQAELAEELFVVQQAVYKWENGISFPQSDKLTEIADVLGVSVLELFAADSVEDLFPSPEQQIRMNNDIPIDDQINSGYVDIDYTEEYVRSVDAIKNKCRNNEGDIVSRCVLSAALNDLIENKNKKVMRLFLSNLDKEILKIGLRKCIPEKEKANDILLGFWRFRYPYNYKLHANLEKFTIQETKRRSYSVSGS